MEKINLLLKRKPSIINIGLEQFRDDIDLQNEDVVQINWTPVDTTEDE